jgi:CRP-like cAMP-binding protein
MLQVVSNRASMLGKKIEYTSAKNIRGRISSYFLDAYLQVGNKEFTLAMKRHELADYLNTPRPSLSREMGLMRDDGIIEFEGPHITVIDPLKLEKSIQ